MEQPCEKHVIDSGIPSTHPKKNVDNDDDDTSVRVRVVRGGNDTPNLRQLCRMGQSLWVDHFTRLFLDGSD